MTTSSTVVDPMVTQPWLVQKVIQETSDTFTLVLEPENPTPEFEYAFKPGQFNMVYVFGVGEVPISICSDPEAKNQIAHTTRMVGTVTNLMGSLDVGDGVGIRGPYGSAWPTEVAEKKDVIVVAGGIGLAPLRPAMYHFLNNRDNYRHVSLLYGARSQDDILYREELEYWAGPNRNGRWLGWDDVVEYPKWVHSAGLDPMPVMGSFDDVFVQMAFAKRGLGMAFLPCMMGDLDPGLRRVPDARPVPHTTLWVLTHPDLRDSVRLRSFREYLYDVVSDKLDLIEGRGS